MSTYKVTTKTGSEMLIEMSNKTFQDIVFARQFRVDPYGKDLPDYGLKIQNEQGVGVLFATAIESMLPTTLQAFYKVVS